MEKIADNADNVHVKWVLLENMILCFVENVLEKVLISLDLQKLDDLYDCLLFHVNFLYIITNTNLLSNLYILTAIFEMNIF